MRSGIGRAGGKAAGSTVRGALQDGQMSEQQMAEQQENGEASTAGTEGQREEQMPDGTLSVTFLDVGQGNAVLVEQSGAYMLIDGGNRDYSSFVVSYLKEQGVEELAYVIASHYDADHLNGVVGALPRIFLRTGACSRLRDGYQSL